MIVTRDRPDGPAIAWSSWSDWRAGREHPEWLWFRDIAPAMTPGESRWCVFCAGNGRLFEMARNGEGLIPTGDCPWCEGSGQDS